MDQVEEVFRHLHTHPEISWEEYHTTDYIKQLLEQEGISVQTFSNMPGLVAEIGSGKPVVAVRADMDALWQEVDGEFKANHSCGHDAHMTIAIGTLLALKDTPLDGTVRFLFQPAEEKGTGALAFVEKGVVDDIDHLYGMHLRPGEELENGKFSPVIKHGAARFIHGKIVGDDAHGARPHLNANAIDIGTELNQLIQGIHINPMVPYSIKMTSFQAGGKSDNIIPGNASFSIDMRAQTNEAMEQLHEQFNKAVKSLAQYHNVQMDWDLSANIAASVTNDEAINFMSQGISRAAGHDSLAQPIVTTGGDDFHFYTIKRPHLKATMLGVGCDLAPGLHHPKMTFDHGAIPKAVDVLSEAVKVTLENY
ncbi:M20 peptidase aminoacylase family protein [Aquisalibacillus elongatus]|uniref:Amidohydrolase n=1 Tax=Aquisalibacillus elongatus TaxID=485577 RepID=A0A3N5C7J9_9BACI|nr:M20 peptidase aminoacylase family protein [Aquisalibacillus elongatus]RPF54335.1 amidohydrolase [Aquisalibacillus elongatus]